MKSLTLALTCLACLVWSSAAMATNTAAVDVTCEGERTAVATFTYTNGANNLSAHETVEVDGSTVVDDTFFFDAPGATHTRTVQFPADGNPHWVSAATDVLGTMAGASDTVVCQTDEPPPCENNCEPPPFCETHPNADICDDPPPPPCEGDECDNLPETGASWALPLGIFGAFMAVVGTFLALSRRRRES